MCDTAKAMFERKHIALNIYIIKEKGLIINDLIFHSNKLGNLRSGINETETENREKSMKSK